MTVTLFPGTTLSHMYLSQNSCMCLGISPWGTDSGDSCSFRTWKSTHLHLSGTMKKGSTGHLGCPACSLKILSANVHMSHIITKPAFCHMRTIKGADQPAHPCSLISAFVVRCLDSIIPPVSLSKISSLYLAFLAVQASLQSLKTGFLVTRLICKLVTIELLKYPPTVL